MAALVGTWDVDGLRERIPDGLFAEWQAFHALRPWDAATTAALGDGHFERPHWLEDIVEQVMDKDRKRPGAMKRQAMSPRAIRRRVAGKKTFLGWTYP